MELAISFGAWYWNGYVNSWSFVAGYCAYIFFSIIGVLQFVAAKWDLRGITFFRNKKWGYAFSALTLIGPAAWFFSSYNCNGLTFDAPVQIFWIALCLILAFLCTFTIAHLLNRNLRSQEEKVDFHEGADTLKDTTYWEAISQRFKGKSR